MKLEKIICIIGYVFDIILLCFFLSGRCEIGNLKTKNTTANNIISEFEERNKQLETTIDKLQTNYNELIKQQQRLKQDYNKLEKNYNKQRTLIKELSVSNTEFETTIDGIDKITKEIEELLYYIDNY